MDRNQSYAQVVHETTDQNATQAAYTHGDDLTSQDTSAIINFYHYDGLGSMRSLTDSYGQITDTYDYTAYGTVLDQLGSTANNYLYTGEQFDAQKSQVLSADATYDLTQRWFIGVKHTHRFDQLSMDGENPQFFERDKSLDEIVRKVEKTIKVQT